ncbi:MAG: 2-dehydropantoate 2-reductase [Nitrospinae bacterium]|nr:2-dehydropantoate 2-reductase [Nitrospinota bacterium]
MRVAIMGTGGTGGFFGGLLARAGEDVTFIARGAHLEAIRASGLTVKSRLTGDFTLRVKATDVPREVGPVELILFCVKTYDTDRAVEQMRPLVGPDTMVLSVQNGIDSAERIARVVGSAPVIGGVAHVFSAIAAPGVIAQTAGPGRILFGELAGGSSPRTERLLRTFQRAGITAELSPDIRVTLWEKFLFICGNGGITALTRLPLGLIRACPETNALLQGVIKEVEAVARACRIPLPEGCVEQVIAFNASVEPGARSSLYHDLATGRRLELEALHGTVVRLGCEHRVSTPLNFATYAALKPYADGAPTLP